MGLYMLREAADARDALDEAKTLGKDNRKLKKRIAAELAYLAATQSADVVAAHLGRPEPDGTGARSTALRVFDRENGTDLLGAFEDVRILLHAECFHEGLCGGFDEGMESAQKMVDLVDDLIGFDQMPRTIPKNKGKKSKSGRR